MRFPGFFEEIRGEAFRWKLVWGVRSGFFVTACFAVFALLADLLGFMPTPWLYALVPLKLFTNVLMWLGVKTRRLVLLTASVNSVTDVFIFTVIIYCTGGTLSPMIPIYFIEIAVLSMLSNLGVTIVMSVTTIVFFVMMTVLIHAGILPAQPTVFLTILKKSSMTPGFSLMAIAMLTFVLGVTTFSASSILNNLRKREHALEAKTRELEEAGKLKREFMRNITHEFRTPIHGILGLTALMEDSVYGPITEKQTEALGGINTSAQTLLQLIDDLLAYARTEEGKMSVVTSSVKIEEVVAGAITTACWMRGRKKLDIVADIPRGLPDLVTDRGKLVHILINLLSNAVKFTPEGGKVEVRARGINSHDVEISVEDTGIGIGHDDLPRIFDEFRQADGSMSRQYGGAGLGLSLVKKYTELLGGRVSVESTPGKGSTFTVMLPPMKS